MSILLAVALVTLTAALLWDNIRLRQALVTALTTPAPVAGALITAKQGRTKRSEPERLPIGV